MYMRLLYHLWIFSCPTKQTIIPPQKNAEQNQFPKRESYAGMDAYIKTSILYIIIIIIVSSHRHGYPWPSLATSPYRPSLW